MSKFEIYRKCQIKNEGVTGETIAQLLKSSLAKHYNESDISVIPTGIIIKGNLKPFPELVATEAVAHIKIEGNQLSYQVDGTSSLVEGSWICLALSLLLGFFGLTFFSNLLIGAYIAFFVSYLISRDRPKQYFDEAFKAVQFDIE